MCCKQRLHSLAKEFMGKEMQTGRPKPALPLAAACSHDRVPRSGLVQFSLCFAAHNEKSYVVDGVLLRTGSANWSKAGLFRQDNDVHYEIDPSLARIFEIRFLEMWDRPTNLIVRDGHE
jgi:phosphatidylserine/phosphatidylglycerophosphate/cardiolipin synthase-like enzyme